MSDAHGVLFSFLVTDDSSLANAQEFLELLKQFGYVRKYESEGRKIVSFYWDTEEIEEKRKRGAGRKPVLSDKTVGEVYDYRQTHTAKETAAFAGMKLRTFQRAEKKLKDTGIWGADCEENHLLYFGE